MCVVLIKKYRVVNYYYYFYFLGRVVVGDCCDECKSGNDIVPWIDSFKWSNMRVALHLWESNILTGVGFKRCYVGLS